MKKSTKRKIIIAAIVVVIAILAAIAIGIYSDYIQVLEIGAKFTKIFWINLDMSVLAWLISFIFVFAVLFINGLILRSNLNNAEISHPFKKLWVVVIIFFAISILFSGIFGAGFANKILLFNNSQYFGYGDPIFYKDIGYYVFQRPFLISICNAATFLTAFAIIVNIITYAIFYIRQTGSKISSLWKINHSKGVATHVLASVLLYFLAQALQFKFAAENVLTANNGTFTGATFTDVNVWLLYYKVAPFVLLAVVIVAIAFLMKSKTKATIATIFVFPAFAIVFAIVAGLVQTMVVLPNEAVKEAPYIDNAIRFTKQAYNIATDNLTSEQYPIVYNLTAKDIQNNQQIVDNIRVTDYDQNIKILNQIQNIRNYFSFFSSNITTYNINGVKTACYISAREINTGNLPAAARNYINLKMKYTHGIGVAMSPVSQITSEGQPATVIKDIPTRSIDGAPQIVEPRIYYGENTNDYAIVGTKSGEFDEIDGDGYKYIGGAGVQLNFWNRVLFAIRNADINLLISGQITSDSHLLINRQVVDRAKKALPFLTIDNNPNLVVTDDGYLVWVLDAYTTTDAYPYSEYNGDYNYIRNSVKITVDAYNGTVKAYIMDNTDPIINAYKKMYPGVFEDGALPDTIAAHISYPETLFTIQAQMLAKYHVTDSNSFYQRDDVWAFATRKSTDDKPVPVDPYYSLVQLGDNSQPELVGMMPYTLVNKENLVSWLAVRCEQNNYGKMVLYTFPTDQNIYGTYQIENKIDTDPTISKDLTLWGQGGSSVVRGNITVVPIEKSLLYVEPIYITSGGNGISEVKGVVVAFNDQVIMADTLPNALTQLFGVKQTAVDDNAGAKSAIQDVTDSWNKYQQAAAGGDWATAGQALDELKGLIPQLNAYGGDL